MGIAARKIVPFKWDELSAKQRFVFTWHRHPEYGQYDALIAHGSVRSGKTVAMAMSFIDWATENFNGENVAIAGKTISSCRRNVIEPLERMMLGRKYTFSHNRSNNFLTVFNPRTGNTVYVHIFGGKDESSQDLVQGITLAGVLFDEVALMPESFVNQAMARCSVDGSKFWFNCNPEHPTHWFKVDWINNLTGKKALKLHFTMDDNLSLSEEVKERYKRLYSGVFYRRYILGEWVAAEGVIYDMFRESVNIKEDPGFTKNQADELIIAADYGHQNPTTYGLYGVRRLRQPDMLLGGEVDSITDIQHQYHLFDSYYHSGKQSGKQKTVREYVDDLENFITVQNRLQPHQIKYIIVDPSAAALKTEIRERKDVYGNQKYEVINAKNDIDKGISHMMNLLALGLFTIDPRCQQDRDEFYSYIWDQKKLERGIEEPLQEHDHCMDRNRYAAFTHSILGNTKVIKSTGGR